MGYTPDISPYALFSWFQPVWIYTHVKGFPTNQKEVGYFLGIDERCIDVMGMKVILRSGKVVIRKDVWAVSEAELRESLEVGERLKELRKALDAKLGDALKDEEIDPALRSEAIPEALFDGEEDDDEDDDLEHAHEPFDSDATRPEADDFTPEAYDQYLSAQVLLPRGADGEMVHATVKARKRDTDGNPIG